MLLQRTTKDIEEFKKMEDLLFCRPGRDRPQRRRQRSVVYDVPAEAASGQGTHHDARFQENNTQRRQ